jgi:hypothetical protein
VFEFLFVLVFVVVVTVVFSEAEVVPVQLDLVLRKLFFLV